MDGPIIISYFGGSNNIFADCISFGPWDAYLDKGPPPVLTFLCISQTFFKKISFKFKVSKSFVSGGIKYKYPLKIFN